MQTIEEYVKLLYPNYDMQAYIDFVNINKLIFINLYIDDEKSFLFIIAKDIKQINDSIANTFDTNDYEITNVYEQCYIITFLF